LIPIYFCASVLVLGLSFKKVASLHLILLQVLFKCVQNSEAAKRNYCVLNSLGRVVLGCGAVSLW